MASGGHQPPDLSAAPLLLQEALAMHGPIRSFFSATVPIKPTLPPGKTSRSRQAATDGGWIGKDCRATRVARLARQQIPGRTELGPAHRRKFLRGPIGRASATANFLQLIVDF